MRLDEIRDQAQKEKAFAKVYELMHLLSGSGEGMPERTLEERANEYCMALDIRFDGSGNIDGIRLPDWIEEIICRRKGGARSDE